MSPLVCISRNISELDKMMAKLNPPFRADHVGSLLRPSELLDARVRYQNGDIAAPELRAIEDEAIAVLVQLEYKKSEAKQMVRSALERDPKVSSAEELLNKVYRQQKVAAPSAS